MSSSPKSIEIIEKPKSLSPKKSLSPSSIDSTDSQDRFGNKKRKRYKAGTKKLSSMTKEEYTKAIRKISNLFSDYSEKIQFEKIGYNYRALFPKSRSDDKLEERIFLINKLKTFLNDAYKRFQKFEQFVNLNEMKYKIDELYKVLDRVGEKTSHHNKSITFSEIVDVFDSLKADKKTYNLYNAGEFEEERSYFRFKAPLYENREELQDFYIFYYKFFEEFKKELKKLALENMKLLPY